MWELIQKNDQKQLENYLSSIKKKKTLTNLLCSKNAVGNTPILEAISQGREKILSTLLDYAGGISINVQDLESGYSPLHKSLLRGDLRNALLILANSNVDYSVKDNEGLTFLEMFEASIKLPKIPTFIRTTAPQVDDVDDSFDDEQQIYESQMNDFEAPSSAMSIFTWGSNNNYLLGSGLADSRSIPEQVNLVGKRTADVPFGPKLLELDPQIIMMASSKYHVAILTKTNLYTYGFGTGGRLGLGVEETQLTPRIVPGIEGRVSFVALGPDHTIVITDEGKVWAWGSNAFSQLGISDQASKSLVPQEVQLKKVRAVGAAASKYHSAIFTDSGAVYTWGTNNGQLGYDRAVQSYPKKITSFSTQNIIQIASTTTCTAVLVESKHVVVFSKYQSTTLTFPLSVAPAIMRSRSFKQPCASKIYGGDNDIAVVLSSGDVCIWNSGSEDDAKLSYDTKRVWLATKQNRVAAACAIGVDSQVVIVTTTGHVFVGSKRTERADRDPKLYKFVKIPNLEHIKSVVASSSGSFAAIRSDYRFPQAINETPSFGNDLKAVFAEERTDYDCLFAVENGERIFAHRIVLISRSETLRDLFSEKKDGVLLTEEGLPFIELPEICAAAMKLVLEFLYTGTYTKPCENFTYFAIVSKNPDPVMARIHQDFKKLVKAFNLDEAEVLQSTFSRSSDYIGRTILDDDTLVDFADVIIELQDGCLKSHAVLLSTRCEYFAPILGKKSLWTLSKRNGLPVILLTHVPTEIFQVLLKWMITDSVDLFSLVRKDSLCDWLDFIKQVQIVADEFLLFKVSDICCSLLARFLTIRNVIDLLQHSMTYNAPILKETCLDFVVRNIETFLKRGILQSVPVDVNIIIEDKIKQLQREKLPLMLGERGYYASLAADAVSRKKERRLKRISSLECVNNVSYETILPSLHPSPSTRGSALKQFEVSPLLMPINVFPSRSNDVASSMEELSLGSSWVESRPRRRSSLKKMTPNSKPPLVMPSSPTCYGRSFEINPVSARSFGSPVAENSSKRGLTPPNRHIGSHGLHGSGLEQAKKMHFAQSPRELSSVKSLPVKGPVMSPPAEEPLDKSLDLKKIDNSTPWGSPVTPTKVASLKLEQPVKSQLSAKLNQNSSPISKPVKLSQRERKRLSQVQQPPAPAASAKPSAAWAIPIPTPKIDLLSIQMDEAQMQVEAKGKSKPKINVTGSTWAVKISAPPAKSFVGGFGDSWKSPTKPIASLLSIQNEELEKATAIKQEKAKSLADIQAEELQLKEYQKYWTRVK